MRQIDQKATATAESTTLLDASRIFVQRIENLVTRVARHTTSKRQSDNSSPDDLRFTVNTRKFFYQRQVGHRGVRGRSKRITLGSSTGFREPSQHGWVSSTVADVRDLRAKHRRNEVVQLPIVFRLLFDVAGVRAVSSANGTIPSKVFGRGFEWQSADDALIGNIEGTFDVFMVGRSAFANRDIVRVVVHQSNVQG